LTRFKPPGRGDTIRRVGDVGISFEAGQCAVLERVATGAPLREVLKDIVLLIEQYAPDALCSIMLLDADGRRVRMGAAPSLPVAFSEKLDGLEIGPNAGSCGAAAYRRERVIVEDIATHPNWAPYREIALPHGLAACWSSPILSPEHQALGTFAIYHRTPRGPSELELKLVDTATHLASVAILGERSRQALAESEERLRAVIENTPDVAIQWYDQAGRMMFLNQASTRILGIAPEAVGKTLFEVGFWSAAEEARFAALREAAVSGQRVAPVEFRFHSPRGGEGVLLSTVFRIPDPKHGSCTVCMDVDMTERRRLQTELAQAQRLTALGALAGGVAHDFNNILTAIQGNTSLAMLDAPQAREHLEEIQQAVARAATLVRQMLTFGRKEAPRREPTSLAVLIDEVLGLLRASLPSSIELRRVFEDTPLVEAEPAKVHQVLMNLVTNASQAIGAARGVIEIGLSRRAVGPETPNAPADMPLGDYVVLSVRDSGSGMDEVTLRRVFEPFFTTKPLGMGTGLGLSVVHGIMKAHGGAISVESRPGAGATFRLYFPLPPAVQVAAPSPAAPSPEHTRARVLLVDDDAALTFLVQRVLTRAGHEVAPFSDPVLALKAFQARPQDFEVVITDVSMPGMPGPALAARLRAIRPDLPVVMITGYVRAEDVEAARRLGDVDVVQRPPALDGYLALVEPFAIARRRAS
jgi:PAS domain S-box-containing protein